jgi:hypothetical protein
MLLHRRKCASSSMRSIVTSDGRPVVSPATRLPAPPIVLAEAMAAAASTQHPATVAVVAVAAAAVVEAFSQVETLRVALAAVASATAEAAEIAAEMAEAEAMAATASEIAATVAIAFQALSRFDGAALQTTERTRSESASEAAGAEATPGAGPCPTLRAAAALTI